MNPRYGIWDQIGPEVVAYSYRFSPIEAAEQYKLALSTIYDWRKRIQAQETAQ